MGTTMKHRYWPDPQSGAGNCGDCQRDRENVLHPHEPRPAMVNTSRCVCGQKVAEHD